MLHHRATPSHENRTRVRRLPPPQLPSNTHPHPHNYLWNPTRLDSMQPCRPSVSCRAVCSSSSRVAATTLSSRARNCRKSPCVCVCVCARFRAKDGTTERHRCSMFTTPVEWRFRFLGTFALHRGASKVDDIAVWWGVGLVSASVSDNFALVAVLCPPSQRRRSLVCVCCQTGKIGRVTQPLPYSFCLY